MNYLKKPRKREELKRSKRNSKLYKERKRLKRRKKEHSNSNKRPSSLKVFQREGKLKRDSHSTLKKSSTSGREGTVQTVRLIVIAASDYYE